MSEKNSINNPEQFRITRRHLPHWTKTGATYFITFNTINKMFTESEREIVLDHMLSGAGKFYDLIAAIIMPDHVHIVITPKKDNTLSNILKSIKGVSARLVNKFNNTTGSIWQSESFDRIIRDEKELYDILEYLLNNPVKKGLIDDPWKYDGWYYNEN